MKKKDYGMSQDERWLTNNKEVKAFIEREHRNPSRHRKEEHDMLNWLKANHKALNAGKTEVEVREVLFHKKYLKENHRCFAKMTEDMLK